MMNEWIKHNITNTQRSSSHEIGEFNILVLSSPWLQHQPNNLIVSSVVLRGENYGQWAWLVRNAFKANNKLGFFDGIISQPSSKACFVGDSYPTMTCVFFYL